MKEYLNNIKDFSDIDVENANEEYINFYNRTIKSSTKYNPNEVRDLNDPNLIEIILTNIIKSFKNHYIKKMK